MRIISFYITEAFFKEMDKLINFPYVYDHFNFEKAYNKVVYNNDYKHFSLMFISFDGLYFKNEIPSILKEELKMTYFNKNNEIQKNRLS